MRNACADARNIEGKPFDRDLAVDSVYEISEPLSLLMPPGKPDP